MNLRKFEKDEDSFKSDTPIRKDEKKRKKKRWNKER